MMGIMAEQNDRLRQHPEQRFDPPQIQVDLEEVAATLLAESVGPNRKHRQQTIYRHGPLTLALFLFEAGASLPQHTAKGVVTVRVLQGRLKISAMEQVHELRTGSVLVLAPGVEHDVVAVEASRMLLTVFLDSGNH